MTENRRIILNIVATYGRSLFALACGLFSGRWLLMALGEVDYGLYGVVGGLTAFIAFVNTLMADAVGRFYAYAVGRAKMVGEETGGLEVCRQWFNTAVLIHTVVPLVLIAIGYPIGMWAVEHFLTIPLDRVEACRWVFRFVCISCFVGMVNVPFRAMYTAKQYIAELTIYSFATTTLNVTFLYFMVTHPGDWLAKYALWACFLSVAPQVVICLRALQVFPECRFRLAYLWSMTRNRQLMSYAGWQSFTLLGYMLRGSGLAVVVNKHYGPSANAAMTISGTVASHADTLSGSLIGAFGPAIINACGENDWEKMRRMAYRACKVGTLLILLFALPLALELPEVLRLWLKNPPEYTVGLCWAILAMLVVDKFSIGHILAINAVGKVANCQFLSGLALIATLPLACIGAWMGMSVYVAGISMAATMAGCAVIRVWCARRVVGMSVSLWFFRILVPMVALIVVSGGFGMVPQLFIPPSFLRICLTAAVSEIVLVTSAWLWLLDADERQYLVGAILKILGPIVPKALRRNVSNEKCTERGVSADLMCQKNVHRRGALSWGGGRMRPPPHERL